MSLPSYFIFNLPTLSHDNKHDKTVDEHDTILMQILVISALEARSVTDLDQNPEHVFGCRMHFLKLIIYSFWKTC